MIGSFTYSLTSHGWVRLPIEIVEDGYQAIISNPYTAAVHSPITIVTLYNDEGNTRSARIGGSANCHVIYPGYSCTMGLILSSEEGVPYNMVATGKLQS
jgi:hypothetical protein